MSAPKPGTAPVDKTDTTKTDETIVKTGEKPAENVATDGPVNTDQAKRDAEKADAQAAAADIKLPKEELEKSPTDSPPDPYTHSDAAVDTADSQASDAIRAQQDNPEALINMGYQTSQFDSSGGNVLDALAFPPAAAVRAQAAVDAAQKAPEYEVSDTDVAEAAAEKK